MSKEQGPESVPAPLQTHHKKGSDIAMKIRLLAAAFACFVLLGAMCFAASAHAQTSTSFALDWYNFGGGGRESQSGSFAVYGTFAQPVVSRSPSTSPSFAVTGGYMAGIPATRDSTYLPWLTK